MKKDKKQLKEENSIKTEANVSTFEFDSNKGFGHRLGGTQSEVWMMFHNVANNEMRPASSLTLMNGASGTHLTNPVTVYSSDT